MPECQYTHCKNKEIADEDLIMYRGKPHHRQCYEDILNIRDIKQQYIDHISSTVVQKLLGKVVNDIIFTKKVPSDFFLYAIKFAINNKIKINSPMGLHYIVDNNQIKDAYRKTQADKVRKEIVVNISYENKEEVIFTAKPNISNGGFGDILKRK